MYFLKEKIERTERFIQLKYGERQTTCTACNGSGYYDDTDSPDCGACDGTGIDTVKSNKASKQIRKAYELVNKKMTENNNNYKNTALSLMNLNKNHLFLHGVLASEQVNNKSQLYSNCFYKKYAFVSAFQILEKNRIKEKLEKKE